MAVMRFRAGKELRTLMARAGHIPKTPKGYGTAMATGVIRGHQVSITGCMVKRCTMDGWGLVPMFRCKVDGKPVSRAKLFHLCGEEI